MNAKPKASDPPAQLRHRAEDRLRDRAGNQRSAARVPKSGADAQRLLHELQVHQIELEMQNAELRQTRDELEAALDNYTDLYDFAPAGYFTLAAAGTIRQVNLTGAYLVGIERSRLVGQSFGLLVSAAQRPIFNAFLKGVFTGENDQSIDVELLNKTPSSRVVRVRAKRSPTGLDCRIVVVDITELKREEDKVRVSEIRYRRLFEAAQDGVLLLDPVTRKITDVNPLMTKLLGQPPDQFIGKELHEIGLLKDEAASREMFEKLKTKHEVRYEDLPLAAGDGRHQQVEVAANLYQENSHSVIQCNIRDITERKRAEQAVRASEERYRILFDLGPVAVYSCDAMGVIQNFNKRAAELWGRKPAAGKRGGRFCGSFKLFRPNGGFVRHADCPMVEVLSGKIAEVRDQEVVIERPDASRVSCVVNIRPLKNHRGEITGAINCFYDITEWKRAEKTKRRLEVMTISNRKLAREIIRRETLEQALKISEQQLRHLSHEILLAQEEERKRISRELHDTVLQTLVGINIHLASLTPKPADNPRSLQQKIAQTQLLVEKSLAMVHRFAVELRPTVLDDLGLIPALHTFMKDFMKRTGVRTRLTAYAAVNQLPIAISAVLYRVALEALNNVAIHAQASDVEVEIKKLPDSICLTIKDNGKSFDVKRVLSAKGNGRLGLLGMRERLEMISGTFSVESPHGLGTTVTARIPIATEGAGKSGKQPLETNP
jgi:PAS domain S-box-containing protein